MERYELILSHYYVEDELEEEIEAPYVVSVDIKTLEENIQYSKVNILLTMCNELISYINKEEINGKILH
jgi:hypothetical protein